MSCQWPRLQTPSGMRSNLLAAGLSAAPPRTAPCHCRCGKLCKQIFQQFSCSGSGPSGIFTGWVRSDSQRWMGELVALDPQRTTVQVAESGVATVTLEGGAATITAPEPVTTTRRVRFQPKLEFFRQVGCQQGSFVQRQLVSLYGWSRAAKPRRSDHTRDAAMLLFFVSCPRVDP